MVRYAKLGLGYRKDHKHSKSEVPERITSTPNPKCQNSKSLLMARYAKLGLGYRKDHKHSKSEVPEF